MADETLTSRIARVLADRIIQGQLAPGEKLRQDHIAAEFGASHVPVREALLRLEAQGLAISEPRRGMRVTTFAIEELREVAEMRSALESLALRHAAPHMTPRILADAQNAARAVDDAVSVHEWEAANRLFHRLILAPCGMSRLLSSIDDLHAASARFLFAAWRSDWESRTDHDHRTILAALHRGNTTLACATLARHVGWIGKRQIPTQNGLHDAYAISG